jgi:glycerol-3-phosphate O-acyltransferase
LPRDERFAAVERLGERLMERVGRAIPAVPVAVAAKVFLRHLEAGDPPMGSLEVKARIFEAQEELRERGVEVYVPRQDAEYAAEVGLRMLTLRNLVEEDGGNRWAAVPAERELLAYYARSVE